MSKANSISFTETELLILASPILESNVNLFSPFMFFLSYLTKLIIAEISEFKNSVLV